MNKNLFFYFFSLVFFAFVVGCSKNDDETPVDNTPPSVTNVRLNGQTENIVVAPGSELEIDATFIDNVALGEYKIDIHDDFEEHGHERRLTEDWEFVQTYPLTGTSQTIHIHITVPANATPGNYHFTLQYLDAAGNEGEPVIMDFIIADPESQPEINITSHDFSEEIEVAPGESIILEGTVTDPDGLDEVHIILGHDDHDHSHGRLKDEEPLYEMEYELDGASTFNFSEAEAIVIPANAEPGVYELKITAKDVLGNITEVKAEVHIE